MRKILTLAMLLLFVVSFLSCGRKSVRSDRHGYRKNKIVSGRMYSERRSLEEAVEQEKETYSKRKSYSRSQINQQLQQKQEKVKRIYSAKLGLRVKNSKDAVNYITNIMKEHNGFLEAQRMDYMSIRVPSKNFDAVVNEILKIGEVLYKNIRTFDVSKRYSAFRKRLEIAKIAKKRLLILLKKVKKVAEKVQIIEEIQRLNKQIESLKNSLNAIDSFVNYSIIEVYLKKPILSRISQKVSLFKWINQLNPSSYRLEKNSDVKIDLPSGFVLFDEEKYFMARSPRGSFIRVGKVKNDPLGDNAFWIKALNTAMNLKNYEQIKSDQSNGFYFSLFKYRQLKPFYYAVILTVKKDSINVIEIYFSNEEEYKKYWELFEKKILKWKVK